MFDVRWLVIALMFVSAALHCEGNEKNRGVDLEERQLFADQKQDLSIPSLNEKQGEVVLSFIKSHPDDETEIPHKIGIKD